MKFFVACQIVYEEKYISKYDLHPLMVNGYQGIVQNFEMSAYFCEAQEKGRAKGRLRKVTHRSLIDYRLSIIDVLSLELTLNLVASPSQHYPTRRSLSLNLI